MTPMMWLQGLIGAVVSGSASAVILTIADPNDFNLLHGGWQKLLSVSAVFGLLGAALYLKQNPTPEWHPRDGDRRRREPRPKP